MQLTLNERYNWEIKCRKRSCKMKAHIPNAKLKYGKESLTANISRLEYVFCLESPQFQQFIYSDLIKFCAK